MQSPLNFRMILALCALTVTRVMLSAQAPANDDFADAQVVVGAAVDITGDNSGATLEPGEADPGEYGGASVWYSWTAPSSGWFTIHTVSTLPGNGLDTVLALFSDGASIGDAGMLGHNDESVRWMEDFSPAVYPSGFGPSRLVFRATSGVTYKIAVHGFFGSTGSFDLHIAAEATPEFAVTSVGFAPVSVDISTTTADVDVLVGCETTDPFSYADVSLMRVSNGSQAASDFVGDTDRIAGSATNGTYTATMTVAQYEQPGNWPVRIGRYSSLLDDTMNWTSAGQDLVEDDYIIPQAAARLEVVNTGEIDASSPEITTLTGLPASVDMADGDVHFDLAIDASDAGSGIMEGILYLRDGSGEWRFLAYLDPYMLVSGDINSGSYLVPVDLYADSMSVPPGNYDLQLEIRDQTGNEGSYGPGYQAFPPGATTTITISATAPANNLFADRELLPSPLPVAAAGTTRFASIEAGESNLNGATAASVWYEWTAPATGWVSIAATSPAYYQPLLAVFTGTVVTTLQELGRNDGSTGLGYGDGSLVFQVTAGSTYQIAVYGDGAMSGQTGAFNLAITVAATPASRVTGFSILPTTVDVTTGDQIATVQVTLETLTDFASGSYLSVYLTPNHVGSGDAANAFVSHLARISGSATNGTYQTTITLPGYYQPGNWHLAVDVSHAGDYIRWTPLGANPVFDSHLIPQGGGYVIVENTGAVDLAAPVMHSLTGLPGFADVTNPVPVTLLVHVTDDASGFQSGAVYLNISSESSSTSYGIATITPGNRISGTSTDGIYEVNFNLTSTYPPGNYTLEVQFTDGTGKTRRYGGYLADLFPSGSTSTVSISHGAAGYTGWAASQDFGPGGQNALLQDANADGTANLLCYAFNLPPYTQWAGTMAPGAGDTAGLPAISVVGDGPTRRLRIEYLQRIGAGSGLTYRPQFGGTLSGPGAWSDAVVPPPVPINSDWERIIIDDTVTGDPSRFGRVTVEYTGP